MEEEMLISSAETHSSEASSLIPDDTPPRKPRPFSAPASETAYGLRENPKKTRRALASLGDVP
ncbi:hypothetical protein QJS10_CPB11g02007 [Acorus calamus]|uniref:Uncharacterized protein n=1 Tax=Acorus calamus TaxID=4465 RepID=A0AAV9DVA2_ACOCL|nr:hypothetical protein QJS10_CPB11g02007 [Acorus calamus]